MSLEDYRKLLEEARKQEPSEKHFIVCGISASKIENALWQSWASADAAALAIAFRAEQERSREATGA